MSAQTSDAEQDVEYIKERAHRPYRLEYMCMTALPGLLITSGAALSIIFTYPKPMLAALIAAKGIALCSISELTGKKYAEARDHGFFGRRHALKQAFAEAIAEANPFRPSPTGKRNYLAVFGAVAAPIIGGMLAYGAVHLQSHNSDRVEALPEIAANTPFRTTPTTKTTVGTAYDHSSCVAYYKHATHEKLSKFVSRNGFGELIVQGQHFKVDCK